MPVFGWQQLLAWYTRTYHCPKCSGPPVLPPWTVSPLCRQYYGVEWYLGTLAIFYLLAPYLYKIINSLEKSAAFFLLSAFLCRILSHFIYRIFPEGKDSYIYSAYAGTFNFFAQFPVLIAGIMLYFLFQGQLLEKITRPKLISYVLLGEVNFLG